LVNRFEYLLILWTEILFLLEIIAYE